MTMLPKFKRCPKCKRKFLWNPDVGNIWCPECGPKSVAGTGESLLNINKDKGKENK